MSTTTTSMLSSNLKNQIINNVLKYFKKKMYNEFGERVILITLKSLIPLYDIFIVIAFTHNICFYFIEYEEDTIPC